MAGFSKKVNDPMTERLETGVLKPEGGRRDAANAILKELMRLGFVENEPLPSSGNSAYAYKDAKYQITAAGREWVSLVESPHAAALGRKYWSTANMVCPGRCGHSSGGMQEPSRGGRQFGKGPYF
jgi:hypothetical protein